MQTKASFIIGKDSVVQERWNILFLMNICHKTATINIWERVRREQKTDVLVNVVGNRKKIFEVKILNRKRDAKQTIQVILV